MFILMTQPRFRFTSQSIGFRGNTESEKGFTSRVMLKPAESLIWPSQVQAKIIVISIELIGACILGFFGCWRSGIFFLPIVAEIKPHKFVFII